MDPDGAVRQSVIEFNATLYFYVPCFVLYFPSFPQLLSSLSFCRSFHFILFLRLLSLTYNSFLLNCFLSLYFQLFSFLLFIPFIIIPYNL